jgi:hypothetical protein
MRHPGRNSIWKLLGARVVFILILPAVGVAKEPATAPDLATAQHLLRIGKNAEAADAFEKLQDRHPIEAAIGRAACLRADGKFLAAWAFIGVALLLTFPIWITVNYLGNPDNGVIVASYVGSFLMAGAYLAISAAISAMTNNQVIAFVVSVLVCFLFTISGAPLVLDFFQAWAPVVLVNTISGFSFLTHFQAISSGVIDLRDLVYFSSLIALFLIVNVVLVDLKKTD